MPASLRIEIFPADLPLCIDFYCKVLRFTLIKRNENYAYLQRDNIFIGAIGAPSDDTMEEKSRYRQPHRGVEIVFEVDDLEGERDCIVGKGWKLDADIQVQPWGLKDFRLVDLDGYYLRVTTYSARRDGTGV